MHLSSFTNSPFPKFAQAIIGLTFFILYFSTNLSAEVFFVSSQQEFDSAHDNAALNDSIIWKTGIYSDIFMDIDNDNLFIAAEVLGSVVFKGSSRVDITGDFITLQGFQFLYGNIGSQDVIHTRGSYNIFTQINIRAYRSYKYLRVREESQYCEITYCNFENRPNLDDQNILSILVDNDNPGYHKIQHCSFKNFEGTGNDLGIEPIRIGVSSQADYISRTLVEYCYFTECDGDGELISSKARQNVYRFNTFENNSKAELVLRHGSENIVYGNFFLNGKGGVRVREGQDQYIYNNYFYNLNDRPIYLQNEDSDPLDNINIAFNTILECAEMRLGGGGSDEPTNVTIANNIFSQPDGDLFDSETGTETWIGNIAFGDLGIPLPDSGLTMVDPQLEENSEGYLGLGETSPAIDAAMTGYDLLPQYNGIDGIDADILFDLMGQERPSDITQKDLGANEFPHNTLIQPIATEENTGPSYETSVYTSSVENIVTVDDLFTVLQNPVGDQLKLLVTSDYNVELVIELFNTNGILIDTLVNQVNYIGESNFSKPLTGLVSGTYLVSASIKDDQGVKRQTIKFIIL